jgi:hypothetical protein
MVGRWIVGRWIVGRWIVGRWVVGRYPLSMTDSNELSAVKFGRMSKKQREKVEDEVRFHRAQMRAASETAPDSSVFEHQTPSSSDQHHSYNGGSVHPTSRRSVDRDPRQRTLKSSSARFFDPLSPRALHYHY